MYHDTEAQQARHERIRQAIMRFHELLGIMRLRLTAGEQAYERLLVQVPAEERATLPEKALQGRVAEAISADLTPLSRAVTHMQFDARELERAFEELTHIIYDIEHPAPTE